MIFFIIKKIANFDEMTHYLKYVSKFPFMYLWVILLLI